MIRPSRSLCRLAAHSATGAQCRPPITHACTLSTSAPRPSTDDDHNAASTHPPSEKKKRRSFFDDVDAVMERNAPEQYRKFVESKRAMEARRAMQQRNEEEARGNPEGAVGAWAPAEPGGEGATTSSGRSDLGAREWTDVKDDIPSYKRSSAPNIGTGGGATMRDVLDGAERPATGRATMKDVLANNLDKAVPAAREEVPWYKRRSDMSDYAAGRAPSKEVMTGEGNDYPSIKTTTLPNKYQNLMRDKSPPEPAAASSKSDGPAKKKTGVFSSISQTALEFKDAHGKTSKSIPLAELFPTLYGKDANKPKEEAAAPEKPRNPAMMYDENDFDAYQQAMEAIFADERGWKHIRKFEKQSDINKRIVQRVKEWLLDDHRVMEKDDVQNRWNNLDEVWRTTGMSEAVLEKGAKENESTFLSELREQREVFLAKLFKGEEATGNESPDQPESPEDALTEAELAPEFHKIATQIMGILGRYCARRARSAPMEVAWWKVKESGMVLPKEDISTYLYVVSTMGMESSIGLGGGFGTGSFSFGSAKKDADEAEASEELAFLIPEEIATYHDLTSKPTESSISLRVKAMASKGDAREADELLEKFKGYIAADDSSEELIRLRTYLPILKEYCDKRDVGSALSVFKRMQTTEGVILEPENYILLLATIAENKFFCDDSPPIEGATDLGYSHSHGPKLFDEIAAEFSADALEITSASARRMYNALAIGFKEFRGEDSGDDEETIASTLEEVHPLMSMPLTTQSARRNEVVASRVSLDRSTGICPATGCQQRLIVLEPDQRKQLHDDLLDLSVEQFAQFAGKRLEDSPESAKEQLLKFSNWLDEREGEPFTAIIDGANVGYYMQSFEKGRFNYHQIKFMIDTLEERGEKPLVVLPYKYGWRQFYSTKREQQTLDGAEMQIMKDLNESGKLYRVPPRCLDDFYWMVASVSDQTASRKGRDLSVPSDDPGGRFPGARPMLISNDQMRDHKLELLEPRLFRRWYGCHIVNYNFTAFVMGESVDGNEIGFSPADFFSREIQGNPCPADEESEWDGQAWHFPVNDFDLDERFVVRIPTKK
ncbi:hypothetical protein ACHAXT_009135 [Thalassiosira profunda]